MKKADADAAQASAAFDDLHKRVGNVVGDGVPEGGEDDYVVLENRGTPGTSTPRDSRRGITSNSVNCWAPSTSSGAQRSPAPGSTT